MGTRQRRVGGQRLLIAAQVRAPGFLALEGSLAVELTDEPGGPHVLTHSGRGL